MVDFTSKTIFSRIPSIIPNTSPEDVENNKISDWLEKLHIQGEKVRIDNNRREEKQLKTIAAAKLENDKISKEKARNQMQSGIDAHARISAAKDESDRQIVNDLVRKSNRRIISISSSSLWSFFPDTINVEESRVTFKFSQFLSSQSHSVEVKDI